MAKNIINFKTKGKNIMKKIIGIVIASLLFCNIGFAAIEIIESEFVDASSDKYNLATFCIDGYKFVVITGGIVVFGESSGKSIVQFYKPGPYNDSPSYPAKC